MSRIEPYRGLLGEAFESMHPHVRRAHTAPLAATGTVDVEHGRHWLTPLMVFALGLPQAGRAQPVRLDVVMNGADMEWWRRIGRTMLHTRQRAEGRYLVERRGVGRIAFGLDVRDGALRYTQAAIYVAGIRAPRSVGPFVAASVAPTAGGWHVDVSVAWRGRLMCHYAGDMQAE